MELGPTVILGRFSCAASRASELQWPTWHQYEAPGLVLAPLEQEASSRRGAPANHCCSPLKNSCLWAVEWKCKTKTPFVLLRLWMCVHWVETQLAAQRWGFGSVMGNVDKLVLWILYFPGQMTMTLLKPSSVASPMQVIRKHLCLRNEGITHGCHQDVQPRCCFCKDVWLSN